ncbi:MAG TPA: hypothetical protein VHV77_05150 [Pirellulales bacterium]|jgi:hypothetical protein|nr:hypothetical protein [Pirellulales bacterium]
MRQALAIPPIFAVLLVCNGAAAQAPQPAAALVAAVPPAPVAQKPPDGNTLLAQALERLQRYKSISAKIRQKAEMYDLQMIGTGLYLQGPAGSHCMRLELKMQVEDEVSTLQQVCDGRNLWILRRMGMQANLGRVEINPVLELQRSWQVPGQGAGPPGIGIGGLPRLLCSLNHSFQFADPVPTKLGTFPVYELHGSWRPEALIRMLPNQKADIEKGSVDLSELPDEVPGEVYVLLGRHDLFPYRIEYRRRHNSSDDAAVHRVVLVMELFEVRADATIESRLFEYQPGELPISELTAVYTNALQTR